MIVNYASVWGEPSSAWWAKANRAKEHLDELDRVLTAFRMGDPYSLTPELTDVPDRLAYRLRFHQPFPVQVSTIIGDAVNNLRGALECLAFEMARRSQGGAVPATQERASTFPICRTPVEFEKFFTTNKRDGLYDGRAREAFRLVQPFWFVEMAQAAGVEVEQTYDETWHWEILPRLNHVWNLDKHRRLALMAWWPDLIYWGSSGPSNRSMRRGDGSVTDGSILFYIDGHDEGQGDRISHGFNIVLIDDPAFDHSQLGETGDVVELLRGWHQHVVSNMFPKIFTVMSRPRD